MTSHIAFLRSVNLGKRRVTGPELIEAFEAAGFTDVWTFLASGNVGFVGEGPDDLLAERIAEALGAAFAFQVPTFVRSAEALRVVAADDPFDGRGTRFVAFATDPLGEGVLARLEAVGSTTDHFAVRGRDLLWSREGSFSDSVFAGPRLEKVVGVPLTVRKGTTLERLVRKV